jgi:hypothetical protein
MGYGATTLGVGNQPILDIFTPDTTQRHVLGKTMWADDPYLGGGCFIYAKAVAAYAVGIVVTISDLGVATAVPNTAGLGVCLAVARNNFAINTYGWFQVVGVCPLAATATVTAGNPFAISGAGTVGALANGKQILNAISVASQTGSIAKTATLVSVAAGQTKTLIVKNMEGLWVGQAVSGTGIGASAVITALDPNGHKVTVDVASTATGSVTVTFTYTGFHLCRIQFPFAQGQVA